LEDTCATVDPNDLEYDGETRNSEAHLQNLIFSGARKVAASAFPCCSIVFGSSADGPEQTLLIFAGEGWGQTSSPH